MACHSSKRSATLSAGLQRAQTGRRHEMEILAGLTGLMIGGAAAWELARRHAAGEMSRLRAQLQEQIGYWQDEAERARANAARVSEKAAAWAGDGPAAGWRAVRTRRPR
jgi:hypothetical protein